MYCCPIEVWCVTSWNTLLAESPLFAKVFVVICNRFCQCNLLHVCDVYRGDVASVVSDFYIVAMHLHHSVVSFVQGLEAFGCFVLDQGEVTCLGWRFTSLLVVMFLHVTFSAVKKLLRYYLVDILESF